MWWIAAGTWLGSGRRTDLSQWLAYTADCGGQQNASCSTSTRASLTATGVEKLLQVIADSPLGVMPVRDVAQRIDVHFKGIWRRSGEAMGVYLVREDEAYGRLAAALLRAQRTEGAEASSGGVAAETAALEESTTPASSAAASATAAFKRKASALEVLPAEVRGGMCSTTPTSSLRSGPPS